MANQIYFVSNTYNETLENLKNSNNATQLNLKSNKEVDDFFSNNDATNIKTLVLVGNGENLQNPVMKYTVDKFLENNIPITCLKLNSSTMIYLFGLSTTIDNWLVQPYDNSSKIINLLGEKSVAYNISTDKQIGTTQQFANTKIIKIKNIRNIQYKVKRFQIPATPIEIATQIEDILSSPPSTGTENNKTLLKSGGDTSQLPPGQINTTYIKSNDSGTLINTNSTQEYSNALVLKVDLVASFDNPPYKYLQISTLGAGLNPTNGKSMYWDSEFHRGWWQNSIDISYTPKDNTLTTLETSPKNINNQTTYKSSSTFTVGVDVATNPGFKPGYTIYNEYQSVVSDFIITNKSSGNKSLWNYQLGLTANNKFDIFSDRVLLKPTVKPLPALAKQNLQPLNISLWYVDKSFNDIVTVNYLATIYYMHAESVSEGLGWSTYVYTFPLSLFPYSLEFDFSQVNA